MRILRLVDSEDSSLEELTEIISTDPALSAKVLRFMNSPLVGAGYQGTTLAEAITRIGMRGAKMMALSFSLVSAHGDHVCRSFDFSRFWSESLARALSQFGCGWNVEDAFVTALVCELGKLVYATAMPEEYEPVLSGEVKPELSLREREHAILGADRFEIAMCLLKDWQLPETVWRNVGELGVARGHEKETPVQILELAQAVAEFICDKERHNGQSLEELTAFATSSLQIEQEDFSSVLKTVGQEWVDYGRLLTVATETPPDVAELEKEAEEHRMVLRLATEMEVKSLRTENEQLSHLARRDRLTGLFNRRAFDAALEEAIEMAEKNDGSVTLVMIDADHFKSVNDDHGHLAGDAVLRHLARVISDNVRRRDEVFRYGGAEFVVIAENISLEGAEGMAESIRAAVETTPCTEDGRNLPMTVSAGIARASWPEDARDGEALLKYADDCRYEAKRDGRNRSKSNPVEASSAGVFSRFGKLFATRSR